jgi:hypothetical protein
MRNSSEHSLHVVVVVVCCSLEYKRRTGNRIGVNPIVEPITFT